MFLCFFSSSAELEVGVTPGTSYAMEYSSLQITCTAYDDANEEMPESIQFIEIDDYSNTKNLTDKDSNLNFTTTREGKKPRKVCKLCLDWERHLSYEDNSTIGYQEEQGFLLLSYLWIGNINHRRLVLFGP